MTAGVHSDSARHGCPVLGKMGLDKLGFTEGRRGREIGPREGSCGRTEESVGSVSTRLMADGSSLGWWRAGEGASSAKMRMTVLA